MYTVYRIDGRYKNLDATVSVGLGEAEPAAESVGVAFSRRLFIQSILNQEYTIYSRYGIN